MRLATLLLALVLGVPGLVHDQEPVGPISLDRNPRIHASRSKPSEGLSRPLRAVLACIRSYEGGYRSNTGTYFGAYQFLQSTWDAVARRNEPRQIGVRPDLASAPTQDRMAAYLYREQGLQPWPTPAKKC